MVGAVQVEDLDEIMLITDNGTLVRTRVNEVSVIGRNTQGVRIIRTVEGEHVVALQRIDEIEDLEEIGDGEQGDSVEGEVVDTPTADSAVNNEIEDKGEDSSLNDDTPE